MNKLRRERTVSSALWAAFGDIVGFPTELVDEAGVQRRLGEFKVSQPKSWKRMVGGRFGVWIKLDAGSYSDDTQLRLACSRSIMADGYFDVEAFAKVELPVWLSYSLGAGRGSKLGAASLSQRNSNWFSNFFEQGDVSYTRGGGNGAAMRIQPHVWAASDLANPATYLPEVIQNAVCTHGHPRGIAGAVIHAVSLAHILQNLEIPSPTEWKVLGQFITIATSIIEENPDLSTFWLPTWNKRTGMQFAEEMERVRVEWERDVDACAESFGLGSPTAQYESIVEQLGGLTPQERGSGIKSALFSLAAAWLFRNGEPSIGLLEIANLLGSDTDTIATMAGSLLGAMHPEAEPPQKIQDYEYIISEANRLFRVSQDDCQIGFQYPDIMQWQPPKSQLDTVGLVEGRIWVSGLGFAQEQGEEFISSKGDSSWQWLKLNFGQTILCKRRRELSVFSKVAMTQPAPKSVDSGLRSQRQLDRPTLDRLQGSQTRTRLPSHPVTTFPTRRSTVSERESLDKPALVNSKPPANTELDSLTDEAIRSGFDPAVVGAVLLDFAELPDGIEKAIAYAAVIVKAKRARLRR